MKQATEILRDMVPVADRLRFDRHCAREMRRIERETWWYRHFAPYRWYAKWAWNR